MVLITKINHSPFEITSLFLSEKYENKEQKLFSVLMKILVMMHL